MTVYSIFINYKCLWIFANSEDVVYMDDEDEREEYVCNESGAIWVGSYWRNRKWNVGQVRF